MRSSLRLSSSRRRVRRYCSVWCAAYTEERNARTTAITGEVESSADRDEKAMFKRMANAPTATLWSCGRAPQGSSMAVPIDSTMESVIVPTRSSAKMPLMAVVR